MSKFSFKSRALTAVGVAVPLVIFFSARSAASWRPERIGIQPLEQELTYGGPLVGGNFLSLSPDEKWLLFIPTYSYSRQQQIWDLDSHGSKKTALEGIKFSSDSKTLAGVLIARKGQSVVLQTPTGNKIWSSPVQHIKVGKIKDFSLSEDSVRVIGSKTVYVFDRKTGVPISKFPTPTLTVNNFPFLLRIDGTHNQVRDSKTGKVMWSFINRTTGNNSLCFPQWEDKGKVLTTIEQDTLIVRDSQTGKVLLSHKNNLPTPLKSWAFTRNRDAVYLMDVKGRIFRQRLR